MKNKVIWLILSIFTIYIVFDFVTGRQEEKELQNESSSLDVQSTIVEEEPRESGLSLGDTAYDFELKDMEGNIVKLSDYRGKKVFLNFWASWCPPCRVEMPHLQEFSTEQEDVVVLGVNVTSSESNASNAPQFIEEYGLTFTNLYGTDQLFDLYQVQSLPTSYIIGGDGMVYERIVGPVTKDILETKFSLIK
ncbi:TlpA family protein disulfide reductase [Lacticigenium naphthae]|uniref:TlpA family protein disulfide reductase n=1 Tax=Lacticigenium naphthae TaxID=515351 RepID=UPI0004033E5F|nr:TlpA disulfide reductase family protein [Lacticigenium naphthae]